MYAQLLGRQPSTRADRQRAAGLYSRTKATTPEVAEDVQAMGFWETALRQQIFLGDEAFIARMLQHVEPAQREAAEVPTLQRRAPGGASKFSLEALIASGVARNSAVLQAYLTQGMTMTAIGRALGLSVSRVSRLMGAAEAKGKT